jgi:ribonuclease III
MTFWKSLQQLFSPHHKPAPASGEVDINGLERLLGYRFTSQETLMHALTHRSHSRADESSADSNERLEFLGDSVLGLVIAERLYRDNPDIMEGEMTKTKSLLVSESSLSTIGKVVGLHQFLLLSPEEDRAGGRERASIVSDAFESVLAAVYLDGGLEAARGVITRLIYDRRDLLLNDASRRNFKGELLELVQARAGGMPRYDVVSETGPDHDKTFTVCVAVSGQVIGQGSGNSKKEAEQKAAAEALGSLLNAPATG